MYIIWDFRIHFQEFRENQFLLLSQAKQKKAFASGLYILSSFFHYFLHCGINTVPVVKYVCAQNKQKAFLNQ